jgi:muconolactone D-isomerase
MTYFLIELEVHGTETLDPDELTRLLTAESTRARELADLGVLLRLWRPPEAGWRNVGLWEATDDASLREALASLPMWPWMTASVRPLADHPNDPGASRVNRSG